MKLTELLIRAGAFRTRPKYDRAIRYVQQHWPKVRHFQDSHLIELTEAVYGERK